MKGKPKYGIHKAYKGKVVGTIPPTYPRKGAGLFVLDDNLSQKDLGFLYEVIGYPGVIVIE
jgi:hypothetical protein